MVKQYDFPVGWEESEDGDLVRYKNYAALLESENAKLREALENLVDCPYDIDIATVPKGKQPIDYPEQVVGTMSVGLWKILAARAALTDPEPKQEGNDESTVS